jgi:DNA-binding response OmpR family regulator
MILFVEDEEPLARVFCKTLITHGYDAEYVGAGPEALSVIARRCPDLVITDFLLPGISGIEIARRARIAGYAGPIVLMSGAIDTREGLEQQLAETAVDFAGRIMKPIRLEELVSLVERLTGRSAERKEVP